MAFLSATHVSEAQPDEPPSYLMTLEFLRILCDITRLAT